mgnify:CR=1 FL=1
MKASTVITAAESLQLTKDSGDVYSFSGEVVVEGTGAILVGDSTGLVYVYSNDAAEAVDVGDFVCKAVNCCSNFAAAVNNIVIINIRCCKPFVF